MKKDDYITTWTYQNRANRFPKFPIRAQKKSRRLDSANVLRESLT